MLSQAVMMTLLAVGLLIVNPVSIACLVRCKELRQDLLYPFTMALFINDFLQGILFAAPTAVLRWMEVTGSGTCPQWLMRCVLFNRKLLGWASFGLMSAIALGKLIILSYPLRAKLMFTKAKVATVLTCIWVVLTIKDARYLAYDVHVDKSNLILVSSHESFPAVETPFTMILILTFVISYTGIMVILIKSLKKRQQLVGTVGSQGIDPRLNVVLTAIKNGAGLLVVLTEFLLVAVPAAVVFARNGALAGTFAQYLAHGQGVINSVLYVGFTTPARKELKTIMLSFICRSNRILDHPEELPAIA